MPDNKDYSEWTIEELLVEEKKIRKQEITSSVIMGFLGGIMIYGVANGGFSFIYVVIPLVLMSVFYKALQKIKQNLKQVREEIDTKDGS